MWVRGLPGRHCLAHANLPSPTFCNYSYGTRLWGRKLHPAIKQLSFVRRRADKLLFASSQALLLAPSPSRSSNQRLSRYVSRIIPKNLLNTKTSVCLIITTQDIFRIRYASSSTVWTSDTVVSALTEPMRLKNFRARFPSNQIQSWDFS